MSFVVSKDVLCTLSCFRHFLAFSCKPGYYKLLKISDIDVSKIGNVTKTV